MPPPTRMCSDSPGRRGLLDGASSSIAVTPAGDSGRAARAADAGTSPQPRGRCAVAFLQLRRTAEPRHLEGRRHEQRQAAASAASLVEGGGDQLLQHRLWLRVTFDWVVGSLHPPTGTTGKRPRACAMVEMIVAKETGSNVPTDPTAEGTEPKLKSVLLGGNSRNVSSPRPLEEADRSYPQVIRSYHLSQPRRGPGLWPVRASGSNSGHIIATSGFIAAIMQTATGGRRCPPGQRQMTNVPDPLLASFGNL